MDREVGGDLEHHRKYLCSCL